MCCPKTKRMGRFVMRRTTGILCAAVWIGGIMAVSGHHALEFIDTESYTTPRKGESVVYLRYDYMTEDKRDSSLDRWEWTPGYVYGLTDRLMIDVHTHYAFFGAGHLVEEEREKLGDRDPSPFFEAVAASLQYRVLEGRLLDVAAAGRVEVPFRRASSMLDAEEVYEGVLILHREFAHHRQITLNLIYGVEGSDDHYEFALGMKTPISADPHGIAAGMEFLGEIDDIEDSWSVIPGVYIPISGPDTLLKAGAEIGKNAESTKISMTLMHLF